MKVPRAVGGEGFKRCGRAGIYEVNQWTTLTGAELEELRVRRKAVAMAVVGMMNRMSHHIGTCTG